MSPIDKLKGKPVPELTTEHLHQAGAFGVVVPPLFEGPRKPVDERIADAFERLLALAKEDEDLDLVAVVGVIRALWMADAVPLAWQALAGARKMVEEGAGHAE